MGKGITQHIRVPHAESELMEAATRKPYLQVRDEADSHDGVARIGVGVRARLQPIARMVRFAQLLPEQAIVLTLSQQFSLSHPHALLPIKDPPARDFGAEMCRSERCDVRSSDMNKATIEPWKASVMTLKDLLISGIGVSNEPR